MIKNERQYHITKAQVRRFQSALADLDQQQPPRNISARLWAGAAAVGKSQLVELQEQAAEYEKLISHKVTAS